MRDNLKKPGLWIVKIGSAVLTDNGRGLSSGFIKSWARQISQLKLQGYNFVIVSSGSIAEGINRLGWDNKPHEIYKQQAAAAVGQTGLVQSYENAFAEYNIRTAQILLTHDDIANRKRYLNAKSTISALLKLGVVPIVNENDTVAVSEIKFGDNDSLSSLVANLLDADVLLILTDQEGMYNKDPRIYADAELLTVARIDDSNLDAIASKDGGALGRGGMYTKLQAARTAARSGAMTVIASGSKDDVLFQVAAGNEIGTLFAVQQKTMTAHRCWLAGQMRAKGELVLDDGAVKFVKEQGKSLLPVGVLKISGEFKRGDLVKCLNLTGNEVARGLINYNFNETLRIIGKSSNAIEAILGYIGEPELIHRDNMVINL